MLTFQLALFALGIVYVVGMLAKVSIEGPRAVGMLYAAAVVVSYSTARLDGTSPPVLVGGLLWALLHAVAITMTALGLISLAERARPAPPTQRPIVAPQPRPAPEDTRSMHMHRGTFALGILMAFGSLGCASAIDVADHAIGTMSVVAQKASPELDARYREAQEGCLAEPTKEAKLACVDRTAAAWQPVFARYRLFVAAYRAADRAFQVAKTAQSLGQGDTNVAVLVAKVSEAFTAMTAFNAAFDVALKPATPRAPTPPPLPSPMPATSTLPWWPTRSKLIKEGRVV